MKEVFLRSIAEVSLLEEQSSGSIRILNSELFNLLDNKEYRKRCLDEVPKGRDKMRSMLEEARKTILFNRDDLVLWLNKMKQDAKGETDYIFNEYHAIVIGEAKIDFERVGLLAGIYDQAESFLSALVAIEPLDRYKPHYTILDRLEKLDDFYIKTDTIPGFYSIQGDKRIVKQAFEIKNLDDYWNEYLSLKDKHKVGDGFGNKKYLLRQYHSEFSWELIKIKPREEINYFLDFHLKNYEGDSVDFLNHIEYRIVPHLDGVARSDYPIYQILIKDWLKKKRNTLNCAGEAYLLDAVASVSATFLNNVAEYRKMSDENKYNIQITSFLNERFSARSWTAKDQSMGGSTNSESTANKAGVAFRDIVICDQGNHTISSIECFRLKSVPLEPENDVVISDHLTKIFANEPVGVSPLFIIIYCETKSFSETWNKYLKYIERIDFSEHRISKVDSDVLNNSSRANVKIAKVCHVREINEINVYHIFINMFPSG